MSASATSRTGQLLRRFELPTSATREQLRVAYFEKAKNLHPDIAGKSSEAAFRRIKEEYEEAMRLLREAEDFKRSSPRQSRSSSSRASHGKSAEEAHWEAWQASSRRRENMQQSWQQQQQRQQNWQQTSSQAGKHEEQTPAKRIRNVLLVSGSVFGAAALLTSWSTTRHVAPAVPMPSPSFARPATTVASGNDVPEADEIPVDSLLPRSNSQRLERKVSDYYQKRITKSTVRVRDSDTYESPSAPLRSRHSSGSKTQVKATPSSATIPAENAEPRGDTPSRGGSNAPLGADSPAQG
mmetsp:Transcript_43048/g.99020  ORF Transcript_43048/g.99020 Transcript_43048/m.99020 type:complete len:296 (+) Transcript_43048:73-960(+)